MSRNVAMAVKISFVIAFFVVCTFIHAGMLIIFSWDKFILDLCKLLGFL